MKNSLLIITFLISSALIAQTKVSVSVANFSFTPANIVVAVGDTVEWTNISGSHNVNGTQATFSSNPASFGNSLGIGWVYSFVFTVAGTYNYQCDPHIPNMVGTVTVQLQTGVGESVNTNKIGFYPNPTTKELTFTEYKEVKNITIYSVTGEIVLDSKLKENKLDVSTLSSGTYFVNIVVSEGEEITKKLIIQ